MISKMKLISRHGTRINGVWRWVTCWSVHCEGGCRIIKVFSEKRGVNHA